jgi:ABC-type Fe3+ transport system substrate-binding protein
MFQNRWSRTCACLIGATCIFVPTSMAGGAAATVGYSGMTVKAPNPHAALLFLDFLHSKEGQQGIMKGGLWSPREDIGTTEQEFKKIYLDEKYSIEELEGKFPQWEGLMRQLFMRKR